MTFNTPKFYAKFTLVFLSIIIIYSHATLLREPSKNNIEVKNSTESECTLPCLNGGICNSGVCFCSNNYSGRQCEISYGKGTFIDQKFAIAICILCIVLGSSCVWCAVSGYQKLFAGPVQPVIRTREVYYEA